MTFLPDLDPRVIDFIRAAYGLLLLGMLAGCVPHARRFFQSERWGGYARSSRAVDLVQNPVALPLVLLVWAAVAVLLLLGVQPLAAAAVNVALCRYFFIWMRWRGVLRGMGAPGFVTHWLGMAVLLLQLATEAALVLRPLVVFALQVDLALIFLAAGVHKLRSGYARGHGMELGLANPQWGYWWSRYRRIAPAGPFLRTLNHLAWVTELVTAVAMLVPAGRFAGGLLLIASFALIGTQIRLGPLVPMLLLSGVLFFGPDTAGGRFVAALMPPSAAPGPQLPVAVSGVLGLVIGAYIALLPFVYAGLALNLYGRTRLRAPLQSALDAYASLFGIVLWRVFAADLVDFFVRIHTESTATGRRALLSDYRNRPLGRFAHVGEMITITSVFTTLRYYPSDSALFHERLLRYARTLPCAPGEVLVFEYVSIREGEEGFDYVPAMEIAVEPRTGEIVVREGGLPPAWERSPVHEGARPGTYAPRTEPRRSRP